MLCIYPKCCTELVTIVINGKTSVEGESSYPRCPTYIVAYLPASSVQPELYILN